MDTGNSRNTIVVSNVNNLHQDRVNALTEPSNGFAARNHDFWMLVIPLQHLQVFFRFWLTRKVSCIQRLKIVYNDNLHLLLFRQWVQSLDYALSITTINATQVFVLEELHYLLSLFLACVVKGYVQISTKDVLIVKIGFPMTHEISYGPNIVRRFHEINLTLTPKFGSWVETRR